MEGVFAGARCQSPASMELWSGSKLTRFTLLAGAVVAVVSFVAWIFAVYPDYLHSDSASYLLLAEDIIQSGSWFSPSWHYVSDGISVFDGAQIAVPFVWLLGVTPLALSCAALVAAAVLVWSVYFLGRVLGISRSSALFAGVLCLSGPSMIYLDLMFGYTIAIVVAQHVILLAMLVRISGRCFNWTHVTIAVVMMFLLFAANPKKAFAFSLLPATLAWLTCWVLAKLKGELSDGGAWRIDGVIRALIAAVVVGFCVHEMLVINLHVNTSYAQVELGFGWERIRDNGFTLYQLVLEFLGVTRQGAVFGNPVVIIFRCVLVTLIAVSFVSVSCRAWRSRQWGWIFMSAFVIWGVAAIAVALLLGSPIKKYYGVYYFVYAICPLPIFTIHWMAGLDWSVRRVVVYIGLVPALFLPVTSMVAESLHSVEPIYSGPGVTQKTNNAEKRHLLSWLNEQGVSYGYAPFWDANAMTVLSGGTVRVVPQGALFERQRKAMRWLISERDIRGVRDGSTIFVAVHDTPKDLSRLSRCYGRQRVTRVGSYQVAVVPGESSDCVQREADKAAAPFVVAQ